jgi:hypothetical protein
MNLNKLEREVITDSLLKIQSVQASLDEIDWSKIPNAQEIDSCLKSANTSFQTALRSGPILKKPAKR